jgi:tetratricopeptide (TPR) repeat protein
MRTWLISGAAASALAVAVTGAYAMGGATSGGYGGATMSGMGDTPSEYSIAVRLIKHEKCPDALPHLNNALTQRPKSADVLNYLGYCYRITGSYPASLDYYNRALAIDPDHKGVHEYLGELYLQMNQPDNANKELATLASLCPRGCDERDALTKAIADHQAAPAAPAAAPATPSQQ